MTDRTPPTSPDDGRLDALLARLPAARPPPEEVPLDDGALLALQAGRLSPPAEEALLARLAADGAARDLLVGLGAARGHAPPAAAIAALPAPPARRWLAPTLGLAAAALITFFVLRGGPEAPEYALEGPFGGVQSVRGPEAPSAIFDEASPLRLVLRPADPTRPAEALRVFVADPAAGARLRPAPAATVTAQGGAFRVEGPAQAILGPGHGPRILALALGPAAALEALAGRTLSEARATRGLAILTVDVELRAEAP